MAVALTLFDPSPYVVEPVVVEIVEYPPWIQRVIDRYVHHEGLHPHESIECANCFRTVEAFPSQPKQRWCSDCSAGCRQAEYYERKRLAS